MNNPARRHHYLPQSYLRGFTADETKGSGLYVFDLELRKAIGKRSLKSIAFEEDWHTVDFPGMAPDICETTLGRFEQQAIETIRKVTSNLTFNYDDLSTLISFVSLIAVRVPRFRAGVIAELENLTGEPFESAASEPKNWDDIIKLLSSVDSGWSQKHSDYFLSGGHKYIANPKNYHFFTTQIAQEAIYDLLEQRNWNLFVAEEGSGNFICSDNPVGLIHSPPRLDFHQPWFGDKDTVVTFPLTRRVALVGRFEDESFVMHVDRKWVATLNNQTILDAWRYLYGPQKDFYWTPDGNIYGVDQLFHLLLPIPCPNEKTET
ncbi:MAG: DUF4238 domain-containing protein [Armatimonadota bacterium]